MKHVPFRALNKGRSLSNVEPGVLLDAHARVEVEIAVLQ